MVPTRDTPSVPLPAPPAVSSDDTSGDVDMDDSPPIPEPMDVSVLVDMHFAEVENAFLSGHHLRKVNLQN